RQRLGLADVLIKDPEVIILDEPTLGLDPGGVRELLDLIVQLSREEGLTVLLSSHHLHQVQQVCSRVGLFVGGRLIAEGDIPALSRKLFSGEPFIIEAGFSPPGPGTRAATGRLQESLLQVEGVTMINTRNSLFHISCSRDAAADIARVIVGSGAGLNHLRKKEYGLDDIYHRYFQGGMNYE
ncbi:MAG TPA: AAA family ATPase, partial [Anseongella sp.]|nr:AAA family ATPase [Anseongella sp.]